MTLGKAIERKRISAGMSQRELARRAMIDNTSISRIEANDEAVCLPSTLKAIADVLDMDYLYLLSLNGTIEDDRTLRMIRRGLMHMSADEKEKLLMMLHDNFDIFRLLLDDSDLFSDEMRGEWQVHRKSRIR